MPHPHFIRILLGLVPAALLIACDKPLPEEPIRPGFANKVGDVEGFQSNRFSGRAKAQQPIVSLLAESKVEMVIYVSERLISLAPYVERMVVVFDTFPDIEHWG